MLPVRSSPRPGSLALVPTTCNSRRRAEQCNVLLQVQSGFGRTGEWFATDGHYGVSPDILVMAKGLASGYPLAAVATRAKISASQPPGSMGGTYAGNAVVRPWHVVAASPLCAVQRGA